MKNEHRRKGRAKEHAENIYQKKCAAMPRIFPFVAFLFFLYIFAFILCASRVPMGMVGEFQMAKWF